jgi:hypothetical protein
VTDGDTVQEFLRATNQDIKHLSAQKDIPFSNSKIEAFNRIIKDLFLSRYLENRRQLMRTLVENVSTYNKVRPQYSFQGNRVPKKHFQKNHLK